MINCSIEIRVEACDPFAPLCRRFQAFLSKLRGTTDVRLHTEVEEQISVDGRELERLAYQAYLDAVAAAERTAALATEGSSGVAKPVTRGRDIESLFGTVRLKRLGYANTEQPMKFPLDAKLGLPPEKYSLPLQRHAVEEVRVQSIAEASKRVDKTTGGHIPVRQLGESLVRAAVDFDTFYEQPMRSDNDGGAAEENKLAAKTQTPLLVLSTDASGVTVIEEALRDATRKAHDQARAEAVRGDPMAEPKARRCTKRMAQVTGVWDQKRQVRTPEAIVAHMRDASAPSAPKMPKPQNKRITASLEQGANARIDELFEEADRRDPNHERESVMLIDGAIHQRELVEAAAKKHSRQLTIILDIIHALHYLWFAGNAICSKDKVLTAAWVEDYLQKLLSQPLGEVIAAIRQSAAKLGEAARRGLRADEVIAVIDDSATEQKLQPEPLAAVEKCVQYLLKNAEYVRYAEFLARGLPIATGVIEGACRHLCHDRLDITGARWSVASAEAMLRIRALHTNGDWHEYWAFHVRQELLRNHGPANDQDASAAAA